MARRRGLSRGFVRPAPKTKIWIPFHLAVATLTSNGKTLVSVMSAPELALRPFTILRTRLDLQFRSDQVAASEVPTGAYGVIVVTDIASGIGVTAVPGPLTDTEAAWIVYQGMTSAFEVISAVGFEESRGVRYSIDSKSMRKVGPTDDVVDVFEMRAVGGGLLNIEGRQLIQLH